MSTDDLHVVAVRYGTFLSDRRSAFLNHHIYGEPNGPIRLDYFFWLVRRGTDVLVIDTGFSRAVGVRRGRTMLVDPIQVLRDLGAGPETAPPIVVTHAHYDHIGNLDAFDRSRILMTRREFEFWTGDVARKRQFSHVVERSELDELTRAHQAGRVALIEGTHCPMPGVELLTVGGHTEGQMMVRVHTPSGTVLITSDAVHFYEELERDMPFIYMDSLSQSFRTYELIREMVAHEPNTLVLTGHDADTFSRVPTRAVPGWGENVVIVGG
jgi:glyoxylase-like metal-dependent hydrolase (beta-lactamase superfamily II)